jgi:hypothetical protein
MAAETMLYWSEGRVQRGYWDGFGGGARTILHVTSKTDGQAFDRQAHRLTKRQTTARFFAPVPGLETEQEIAEAEVRRALEGGGTYTWSEPQTQKAIRRLIAVHYTRAVALNAPSPAGGWRSLYEDLVDQFDVLDMWGMHALDLPRFISADTPVSTKQEANGPPTLVMPLNAAWAVCLSKDGDGRRVVHPDAEWIERANRRTWLNATRWIVSCPGDDLSLYASDR